MNDGTVPRAGTCSLAEELVKECSSRGKFFAAAESCTSGLAADFVARIPGASAVFWGSFVTYSIDAKVKMLGVPADLIEKYGPVSAPVALAMAEGAMKKSGASWAFSVTGLAGPGGDGTETPVGTVWIGVAGEDGEGKPFPAAAKQFHFSGGRNEVREAAASAALGELLKRIRPDFF